MCALSLSWRFVVVSERTETPVWQSIADGIAKGRKHFAQMKDDARRCTQMLCGWMNCPGASLAYDCTVVGQYCVVLLVERALLVELKASKAIDEAHRVQCLNYLMAIGLRVRVVLNFGKSRLKKRTSGQWPVIRRHLRALAFICFRSCLLKPVRSGRPVRDEASPDGPVRAVVRCAGGAGDVGIGHDPASQTSCRRVRHGRSDLR